ncbi:TRAP transporter large permease subunit [Marinomonas rhizomae]|uniref:TRAP transporter large permease protein n=1 Tax=Marinomonas rhizomae TaxID=491948 RepID=A0A366JB34_9GAMM|nr:TRAP transporter large permease subunit [Marinomonas rhizomae]RBP83445.1 tripartite ATP-independent transporter DctM subunit [Marinomonas rhizomae]RNF73999.1 TRAP transporter large permease subunit [Marinomonas rhizomae]
MSVQYVTLSILGAMIVLMMLGLPLAFVTMAIAIVTTLAVIGPDGITLIAARMYTFVMEPSLLAVPMFVLMAAFMERSGVAKDLFNAMYVWSGRLRGGVAIQTMFVAVLLAAITGIVGGETVMLGLVALPQLLRLKYNKQLAVGTIAAGGALGTMIPPSIVLIMYGVTAGVSTGELFKATLLPGLLLSTLYMIYIYVLCKLNPDHGPALPESEVLSLSEKLKTLKNLIGPGLIALWVLGSIYGGICSVTEAAAMGCIATFAVLVKRRMLTSDSLKSALLETLQTCGKLFWLSLGATALIGIFNIMGGSRYLSGLMQGLPYSPMVIVIIMMVILAILGMFMDWIGILILTMPIFIPIIKSLGLDPVWFGVLFCMNMQISFISPPFGPACFYLKSVAPKDVSLMDIFRGVIPFIILQVIALAIVMMFPDIALWLPSTLKQ